MDALRLKALAIMLFLASVQSVASGVTKGVVAETIEVKNYIYLRLEEGDLWLATSLTKVSAGDSVEFDGGYVMKDFYSPVLERTFPEILFVSRIEIIPASDPHALIREPAKSHPTVSTGMGTQPTAPVPMPGEIAHAEGGKTIAEIVEEHESLDGKRVMVRAKVLKFSPDILEKNWVTLSDGSGTSPNNKLIATTADTVEVGEVVLVSGIVRSNLDIGSGYEYEVILEQSGFSRQ